MRAARPQLKNIHLNLENRIPYISRKVLSFVDHDISFSYLLKTQFLLVCLYTVRADNYKKKSQFLLLHNSMGAIGARLGVPIFQLKVTFTRLQSSFTRYQTVRAVRTHKT